MKEIICDSCLNVIYPTNTPKNRCLNISLNWCGVVIRYHVCQKCAPKLIELIPIVEQKQPLLWRLYEQKRYKLEHSESDF